MAQGVEAHLAIVEAGLVARHFPCLAVLFVHLVRRTCRGRRGDLAPFAPGKLLQQRAGRRVPARQPEAFRFLVRSTVSVPRLRSMSRQRSACSELARNAVVTANVTRASRRIGQDDFEHQKRRRSNSSRVRKRVRAPSCSFSVRPLAGQTCERSTSCNWRFWQAFHNVMKDVTYLFTLAALEWLAGGWSRAPVTGLALDEAHGTPCGAAAGQALHDRIAVLRRHLGDGLVAQHLPIGQAKVCPEGQTLREVGVAACVAAKEEGGGITHRGACDHAVPCGTGYKLQCHVKAPVRQRAGLFSPGNFVHVLAGGLPMTSVEIWLLDLGSNQGPTD